MTPTDSKQHLAAKERAALRGDWVAYERIRRAMVVNGRNRRFTDGKGRR